MIPYDYSYWRQARPTEKDFQIDVISHHPDHSNKKLKKYSLDGIDTIGVFGDEPFEINFHNKSFEDVQVRLSLDGTDVLTGKAADLEINHNMWVVRAGRTLHLKAWAETNQGGAKFVFTGADKSVALHAHGDISHKGIISAAVFTERDRPYRPAPVRPYYQGSMLGGGMRYGSASAKGGQQVNSTRSARSLGFNPNDTLGTAVPAAAPAGEESFGVNVDMERSVGETKSLKKEAAIGAGEYTEQKTKTVKGLDKPTLNSIVRVRYMWWDDVTAKLKDAKYSDPFPTGFPAEKIKTFADLSNVPRVTSAAATPERVVAEGIKTSITPVTFERTV